MMHRALLVLSLLSGCARSAPEPAPPAPIPAAESPASPAPDAFGFVAVAPGIRVFTADRDYDPDRTAQVAVVRLDLAAVELGLRELPEHRFRPTLEAPDVEVAFNAGFFEPDFSPSGWMVLAGRELAPARAAGGSGVLVVDDGRARLVDYATLEPDPRELDFAIQCGPRLVEPDGTIGITRDAGQRAARTALCIRDRGRTLDVVVAHRRSGYGGPGLRTLAEWLAGGLVPGETGCEAALNLDGGPSTALVVRGFDAARRLPPGPVVWAITVRSLATR